MLETREGSFLITMPYQFIFRESIYHDKMYDAKALTPYKVPDYLTLDQLKGYGWCTDFMYESKDYATLEQAMSDYHDVLMDSAIDSPPAFYKDHKFMDDSNTLFNNYIYK